MAPKCALIVDDSRTARRFLARVLEQHGMRVETAESAEDALAFLSHDRPDVIFMDHLMPGMDGFQAVRAIKNNPATATIPIMMYTSQSGELYVGQARALGAMGVLPKQIKPVEVSALLQSLHLLPATGTAAPAPAPAAEMALAASPGPAEGEELHRWLARMLARQGETLRADLEATVTRVLDARLAELPPPPATPAPSPARSGWLTTALVLVLAAVAGIFFWLHLDSQRKWRGAEARNAQLLATLEDRRADEAEDASGIREYLDAERSNLAAQYTDFLAALEWSVNQSGAYGPGEAPLGDRRLEIVQGLLERLRDGGFAGTVELRVHAGDFCLAETGDGGWTLADARLPAERCARVGPPMTAGWLPVEAESVAFANFRAQLARGGGPIRLQVTDVGNVEPRFPYPPGQQAVSAGDWNQVAARNHRVEVRLLPEPWQPPGGNPVRAAR